MFLDVYDSKIGYYLLTLLFYDHAGTSYIIFLVRVFYGRNLLPVLISYRFVIYWADK